MSEQYKNALRHCYDGMLKMTKDDEGHQLFVYTQECFWGKDTWDDITKTHRGMLYYNGKQVNKPFTKIFNVGEQPETELDVVMNRMQNEEYNVYDKANGHLFFMSCFIDEKGEQHVVFHTKGSFPGPDNDLLNDDVKIFGSMHGEAADRLVNVFPNSTWMFEAIVAHDQHTMYTQQVQEYSPSRHLIMGPDYGDHYFHANMFVLLAGNAYDEEEGWQELQYDALKSISTVLGCPVVKKYDEVPGTPDEWLEHKDREGYVIHFVESGDRVKVKTKEYWLMRFKKDLTAESILSKYKAGGVERLKSRLPEEVAAQIIDQIHIYQEMWYLDVLVKCLDEKVSEYADKAEYEGLTKEERKWLFTESDFTTEQRQYIITLADKKYDVVKTLDSKAIREKFVDMCLNNKEVLKMFKDRFEKIIDNM